MKIYHLNGKIESLCENHEAKLDTLLLSYAAKTIIIDSFLVDNKLVENSKAKEFLIKLNKNNQSQLNELINEVNNNTLQFNKIMASTDSRLSRELNNLNLWFTIWIGLLSVFMVFMPISYYYFSIKKFRSKIKNLQENAKKHQENANYLLDITNKLQEKTDHFNNNFYKREEEITSIKKVIENNNVHLKIFTMLSVLKELSGQPSTFFDNEGRDEIIHRLLSDASCKLRSILLKGNVLNVDSNKIDYSIEFLFIDISITMRQIESYFESRKIIERIHDIFTFSNEISKEIKESSDHSDLIEKMKELPRLFDKLIILFDNKSPRPSSII